MRPIDLTKAKLDIQCAMCKETVTIPPGVWYRGKPYHLQEAIALRRKDITLEDVAPIRDAEKQCAEELLDV